MDTAGKLRVNCETLGQPREKDPSAVAQPVPQLGAEGEPQGLNQKIAAPPADREHLVGVDTAVCRCSPTPELDGPFSVAEGHW